MRVDRATLTALCDGRCDGIDYSNRNLNAKFASGCGFEVQTPSSLRIAGGCALAREPFAHLPLNCLIEGAVVHGMCNGETVEGRLWFRQRVPSAPPVDTLRSTN